MKPRTLLGRLLRLHLLVVASTCCLLVAGTMATSAYFLRRDQDDSLLSVAAALCRGIDSEMAEHQVNYAEASRDFLEEGAIEGIRAEVMDTSGGLLFAYGSLSGWETPGQDGGKPDVCSSRSVHRGTGNRIEYRFCARRCDDRHVLRVVSRDVLDRHDVRRATVALILVLPLAVALGTLAGRWGIARLLSPLRALRNAAARLEARPGVSLSVGATLEELATLERAFDSLLRRLGDAVTREKRFTQEASHELRTPLTILRTRLELLVQGLDPQPALQNAARKAMHDLDSLDRLIDALLVLARSDAAELPSLPVNLCDLAREVAERQALSDGDGSPGPEVDAPDEILVGGSEELLGRALANVVENARKYGGRGVRIRIRALENGDSGHLIVEDGGAGIPPDLRPFVFDRFSRGATSRTSVPGSGLGLAVVKAIVVRHGGDVQTGPSELGGEAIRITLPLLRSPASGERHRAAAGGSRCGRITHP